ncbi:MAG: hypothetical protein WB985_12240 [Candidatus Acidiferrales bacterium]
MEGTVAILEQRAMSWEAFTGTPDYLALTPPMRAWVKLFVEHGDANAATVAAYPDSATPRVLTYKIQSSGRVINALNKYFGIDDKQAFLNELRHTIRKSKGTAKVEAQKLYAQLAFGVPEEPESGAKNPDDPRSNTLARVNAEPQSQEAAKTPGARRKTEVMLVDGLKRRPIAWDADGEPTEFSDEVIQ